MFSTLNGCLITLQVVLYIYQAIAERVQVRPSSGEQILANVTYTMQWNLTGYPSCGGITFCVPWMTPPFTSYLTVDSPWYETMTSTGYQTIVFTEINPTSTTTAIIVTYWNAGFLDAPIPGASPFTMGPFTVISHVVNPPPLTTPPPPPTTTDESSMTKTVYVTIYTATYVSAAALPASYVSTYTRLVAGILVSAISTFLSTSTTVTPTGNHFSSDSTTNSVPDTTIVPSSTNTSPGSPTPSNPKLTTADIIAIVSVVFVVALGAAALVFGYLTIPPDIRHRVFDWAISWLCCCFALGRRAAEREHNHHLNQQHNHQGTGGLELQDDTNRRVPWREGRRITSR